MYCQRCGNLLNPGDAFCTACGSSVGMIQQPMYYQQNNDNGMAITGFILSFIIPLVGLILSIMGYSRAKYMNDSGKGLALAGIIISSIELFFGLIIFIILLATTSIFY